MSLRPCALRFALNAFLKYKHSGGLLELLPPTFQPAIPALAEHCHEQQRAKAS